MEGSGEVKASAYEDAAPNGARRGASLARFVPSHNTTREKPNSDGVSGEVGSGSSYHIATTRPEG
jgi:hypothetical protein